MVVTWTSHRFSGGVLALDVANTVVHRGDVSKMFDRFDDPAEVSRFAAAASIHRAAELGGRRLSVAAGTAATAKVLAIRETTDQLFRASSMAGTIDTTLLHPFLRACADGAQSQRTSFGALGAPFGDLAYPIAFETALALSALSLLTTASPRRVRICSSCCWLFLDTSRNGSRIWCDMAVCGNRQKAKRHYSRSKAPKMEATHG